MIKKEDITYFAKTNSRGREVEFGIKDDDRLRHVYLIGKTGMGKSTMFENMAVQDINKGNGLCFIDPHGSAIETFLEYIPEHRTKDVVYFCPFDVDNPIAFNVMDNSDLNENNRFLVAQGLLAVFKKIFGEETYSDRMVHILNNTLLALLEYPGSTLLSVTRMLTDPGYEQEVVRNISDPSVKAFWTNEYGNWEDRYKKEANAAILNKLGQFNSNPLIRNIVGQEKNSMNFREIMDDKKILLINLSKGQVGEDNANLLGAMITTKIYLAAMSRADLPKRELAQKPNFYLYIDEFQNVANDSFTDILSEARKYKLSILMAHQYIEQTPDTVRAAIFGNVGTTISFRVGPEDGEVVEKLFAPTFYADDIVNLGRFEIYLSLMINGIGSQPFSANTLPPIKKPDIDFVSEVIESSRKNYATSKSQVEKSIDSWLNKKYQTEKEKKNQEKNNIKWEKKKQSPDWVDRSGNDKIKEGNSQKNDFSKKEGVEKKAQDFKKENAKNDVPKMEKKPNFSFKDSKNFGAINNSEDGNLKNIENKSLKEALMGIKIPGVENAKKTLQETSSEDENSVVEKKELEYQDKTEEKKFSKNSDIKKVSLKSFSKEDGDFKNQSSDFEEKEKRENKKEIFFEKVEEKQKELPRDNFEIKKNILLVNQEDAFKDGEKVYDREWFENNCKDGQG